MTRAILRLAIGGLALSGAFGTGCSAQQGAASSAPSTSRTQLAQKPPAAASPGLATPDDGNDLHADDFVWQGALTQGGWIRGRAPKATLALALDGAPIALDAKGEFFAAFDRDSALSHELEARLENGQTIVRKLELAPRQWRIERVNVARSPRGPSAAFLKRRKGELAAIAKARAATTDATGWKQDFIWPIKGRISGLFGAQRIYRGEPGSYHSGVDITTGRADDVFVAPADGVVVLAVDDFSLEGRLLIIDHGAGLNSAFLHAAELLVSEGDSVSQGEPIGRIGMSGRATGPHLHWSLKWGGARLDPLLFVGPMD